MLKLADITSVYRAKLIIEVYRKWIKPCQSVLDIGCGTGAVAEELKKSLNINVEGCDINSYLLRNILFKKMTSSTKLPYKNKLFNLSMFNDVLHHTEYNNQEPLIREAFRVSKKVLIFELIPTKLGKWADLFINKIHNPKMKIPYTYRKPEQWKNMFSEMGLKVRYVNVDKPLLYPFTHIAYLLYK